MRFVHRRVRIQARVGHNAVDEIIDHCGDVIDSTDPLIKAGLRLLLVDMGVSYPCLVFFGNERFVAAKREQAQPPRHLEQELETFSRNGRDIALRQRNAILPGVSFPFNVVRSVIETASLRPPSLAEVLMLRLANAAAYSSAMI